MKSHVARQELMSTREANGLVGAVVRGEEADGASQRAPPHFNLGFRIADFGLERKNREIT